MNRVDRLNRIANMHTDISLSVGALTDLSEEGNDSIALTRIGVKVNFLMLSAILQTLLLLIEEQGAQS